MVVKLYPPFPSATAEAVLFLMVQDTFHSKRCAAKLVVESVKFLDKKHE